MSKYNANGGQRRSKKTRLLTVPSIQFVLQGKANRNLAIKEFGEAVVTAIENRFPNRVWDRQAIKILREALKEENEPERRSDR